MTEQEKYEQFLELRHYGEIIADIDKKINDRLYRVLMIKYNDDAYISILRDGETVSVERVWFPKYLIKFYYNYFLINYWQIKVEVI